MSPRVSVLVPTYNRAESLPAAISSLLNQRGCDLEVVVVDDGSTDSTPDVLDRYARGDRVRVLTADRNLGLIHALNWGLSHIDAEFVGRLDSDDLALPHRFRRQLEFLVANPNIDVLGGHVLATSGPARRVTHRPRVPTSPDLVRWRLLFGCCVPHPSVTMRRTSLSDDPYPDDAFACEDYALWLSHRTRLRIANLRAPVTALHKHAENASTVHASDAQSRITPYLHGAFAEIGVTAPGPAIHDIARAPWAHRPSDLASASAAIAHVDAMLASEVARFGHNARVERDAVMQRYRIAFAYATATGQSSLSALRECGLPAARGIAVLAAEARVRGSHHVATTLRHPSRVARVDLRPPVQ